MFRGSDFHNYNTRHSSNFRQPEETLKRVRQSFFYKGIEYWNKLNPELIIYKPYVIFKNNLSSLKRNIKTKLISKELQL